MITEDQNDALQNNLADEEPLCIDTNCYDISRRLLIVGMFAATGYATYHIYQGSQQQYGNSAQTYITTAGIAVLMICSLSIVLAGIHSVEKSIREKGGVNSWARNTQKRIADNCCLLFFGKRSAEEYNQHKTPLLSNEQTSTQTI